MARKPAPYELVIPRLPVAYVPPGRWKVTARYTCQLSATKLVDCIRVRGPGTSTVLHMSITEFERLFKPLAKEGS